MQPTTESLLLTYDEVADQLRVSRRYVEQLVARHDLPAVRIGGNVRVRRGDLEAYVADLPQAYDDTAPRPAIRDIA
ncbi:MAG TPA: helix-turn-helix domain-containing protein [Nocardioides sp.]|nr:helix-turn-helix domain-containing protein [Nocardioides sp.]